MWQAKARFPDRPGTFDLSADLHPWHTGFDGLDSFGGMIAKLARPLPPARFVTRRVPRAEVPGGEQFGDWLDDQWLLMDAEVDEALRAAA